LLLQVFGVLLRLLDHPLGVALGQPKHHRAGIGQEVRGLFDRMSLHAQVAGQANHLGLGEVGCGLGLVVQRD
jgi:hypothetical protein